MRSLAAAKHVAQSRPLVALSFLEHAPQRAEHRLWSCMAEYDARHTRREYVLNLIVARDILRFDRVSPAAEPARFNERRHAGFDTALAQTLIFLIFVPDGRRSRVTLKIGRVQLDFPKVGVMQGPLSVRYFFVETETKKTAAAGSQCGSGEGMINRSDRLDG